MGRLGGLMPEPVAVSERRMRALIGWLPSQQAVHLLGGGRPVVDDQVRAQYGERARLAREVVAARAPMPSDEVVVTALPSELGEHVELLRASPAAAPYWEEGWTPMLVDLRKVCSFQPAVAAEHAIERAAAADAANMLGLATITLPLPTKTPVPVRFDPTRQAYLFSSPNPNLRVQGNFNAELDGGQHVYGFVVGVSTSFLQVARFQNRYFLRDGYHRAFGLLRRGIHIVPALTRDLGPTEELGVPSGMLPQGAYLGARPPMLSDFLDDEVAADVSLPTTHKLVIIQGLEVSPIG